MGALESVVRIQLTPTKPRQYLWYKALSFSYDPQTFREMRPPSAIFWFILSNCILILFIDHWLIIYRYARDTGIHMNVENQDFMNAYTFNTANWCVYRRAAILYTVLIYSIPYRVFINLQNHWKSNFMNNFTGSYGVFRGGDPGSVVESWINTHTFHGSIPVGCTSFVRHGKRGLFFPQWQTKTNPS